MADGVGITTIASNKRSLTLFIITIVLIFGLLTLFKTYKEISGETIVIEDESDIFKAKETITLSVEGLKQDVVNLYALIS